MKTKKVEVVLMGLMLLLAGMTTGCPPRECPPRECPPPVAPIIIESPAEFLPVSYAESIALRNREVQAFRDRIDRRKWKHELVTIVWVADGKGTVTFRTETAYLTAKVCLDPELCLDPERVIETVYVQGQKALPELSTEHRQRVIDFAKSDLRHPRLRELFAQGAIVTRTWVTHWYALYRSPFIPSFVYLEIELGGREWIVGVCTCPFHRHGFVYVPKCLHGPALGPPVQPDEDDRHGCIRAETDHVPSLRQLIAARDDEIAFLLVIEPQRVAELRELYEEDENYLLAVAVLTSVRLGEEKCVDEIKDLLRRILTAEDNSVYLEELSRLLGW